MAEREIESLTARLRAAETAQLLSQTEAAGWREQANEDEERGRDLAARVRALEAQLETVNGTNRQLAAERDAAQKGSEALAAQGMRDGTAIAELSARIMELETLLAAAVGDRDASNGAHDAAVAEVRSYDG